MIYSCHRLSQDDTDFQGQKIVIKALTFDAGNLVWSLALGPKLASVCKLHFDATKGHYVLDTKDLILAAGALTEIKVWSVYSGKSPVYC